MDALRIVQRGDQRVEDMPGDWAGEFGGMQVTASDYYKNGVDYDGDGRRDIIRSVPDMLATAANFLKNFGWQRGQPWLQEVRVPADLKWEEADLKNQHPRSQWVAWGVTRRARQVAVRQSAGVADAADGAASARRSSPIRISRRSSAGTRPWSIRPPRPISPPGSPARRRSVAAARES